MVRFAVLLAVVAMTGGCAGEEPPGAGALPEAGATTERLVPSLGVRVEGDTVRFALHVTNATGAPVELEYSTAQRYDFAVLDEAGAEVWRWSAGQSFAQMLGTEELGAGETVEHTTAWHSAGRGGPHTAAGRLTSTNKPIELRTPFELPGR